MISVWTIVAEEYDFWVNSGWKICILGQYSGWKIWFWRQFAIISINFGSKIMFPSQIWTHNLYQKWKQLLGHNLHYNMHYDMHIASYACANALRGHNWYVMHAIMGGPQQLFCHLTAVVGKAKFLHCLGVCSGLWVKETHINKCCGKILRTVLKIP